MARGPLFFLTWLILCYLSPYDIIVTAKAQKDFSSYNVYQVLSSAATIDAAVSFLLDVSSNMTVTQEAFQRSDENKGADKCYWSAESHKCRFNPLFIGNVSYTRPSSAIDNELVRIVKDSKICSRVAEENLCTMPPAGDQCGWVLKPEPAARTSYDAEREKEKATDVAPLSSARFYVCRYSVDDHSVFQKHLQACHDSLYSRGAIQCFKAGDKGTCEALGCSYIPGVLPPRAVAVPTANTSVSDAGVCFRRSFADSFRNNHKALVSAARKLRIFIDKGVLAQSGFGSCTGAHLHFASHTTCRSLRSGCMTTAAAAAAYNSEDNAYFGSLTKIFANEGKGGGRGSPKRSGGAVIGNSSSNSNNSNSNTNSSTRGVSPNGNKNPSSSGSSGSKESSERNSSSPRPPPPRPAAPYKFSILNETTDERGYAAGREEGWVGENNNRRRSLLSGDNNDDGSVFQGEVSEEVARLLCRPYKLGGPAASQLCMMTDAAIEVALSRQSTLLEAVLRDVRFCGVAASPEDCAARSGPLQPRRSGSMVRL